MVNADEQQGLQIIQREIVLLVVIAAAAVPLYLGTRWAAEMNRHRNAGIAADLYRRAQRQLASHDPEAAINSLRAAVTNDHNNLRFVFALAQTLAAVHRDDEARLSLLRLRENAPEDPQINLELARLASRHHDIQQAVRYYHHALYGLWTGERIDQRRREVRLELVHLLLDRHERSRALSELLIMSSEAPRDAGEQLRIAELFTEAGDLPRALEHFSIAAELDPRSFAALHGAGRTAFDLGDYGKARRFLARALARDRTSQSAAELIETVRLIESRDPLAPNLRPAEQARRLSAALVQTLSRLQGCIAMQRASGAFGPSRLDKLRSAAEQSRPTITPDALRSDPELLHAGAELVFTIEEVTSEQCGAPRGFDHALLLIGRKHERSLP